MQTPIPISAYEKEFNNTYTSAIKKKEILPCATIWMVLEGIMLSKEDRERHILYDFTYMWNQKKKTYPKPLKPKLIAKEISFVVARGGVKSGGTR